MSTSSEVSSVPELPVESVGSSVSTSLQKEYEELLRYAVVTPKVIVPQMKTHISKVPESTATETSRGSYEQDTEDVQQEVTGLPTTPMRADAGLYKNHGSTENSSEVKETDNSFTSSQSTTPDNSMNDSPRMISPTVDTDLVRMESQLDSWCLDLKRNILAEFAQSKMALLENHKHALRAEKQRHAAEMNKKQNDIESLKELLYTYEKTMEHKDNIISNMTKAIQKQKERFDLLRRFNTWKIKHVDEKKEGFGTNLAKKHRNHVMKCKIWSAWRSLVETRWRQKVEKACQSKAQDVCVKLTDEYEAKLLDANKTLDAARVEVSRLHAEREIYEETMKKAFMRGVCALNLEAMHMFREPGDDDVPAGSRDTQGRGDAGGSSDSGNEMNPRSQLPRPSTSTIPNTCIPHVPHTTAPVRTTAGGGINPTTTLVQPTRTINVKAIGRADFRSAGKTTTAGSGPPGASTVSSVLVQRHSGPDAVQSKPIRHAQPSQNASKTGRTKPRQTAMNVNHPPPVKVVQ
ncbi:centrosomal protein POC5-like [Dendronephthya gigantea]|uniref:centrosomal protein POC5-like n=1 Tax=Dendronephthya gigantea TaxID=151771 RepID=UPI001068F549|nr:centrosomal protein POC5-like [Dendronephthya gigantea]